MQTIESSYRSVRMIMNLNGDRMLYLATLTGALWLGGYLAQM